MPSFADLDSLRQLRDEIEVFLRSLHHPVVVEDEVELFDLTAAEWRLTLDFGRLVFEVWNPARSMARRVEEIAYRDRERMGIFVRKAGARETGTLELRALERSERGARNRDRTRARQELLGLLRREFGGWRFERVSNRSDREFSFSAWYTRGWARQGRTAWAFLGLTHGETHAAADAALAFALVWLDWLRGRDSRVTVPGLKLFLPPNAVELTAHRAAHIDHRAVQLEIFEWHNDQLRGINLKDFGTVETRLVPYRQSEALVERHTPMLGDLLGDLARRVDIVPDPSGAYLSLRIHGLEVARVEGQLAPRIYWGLEGSFRRFEENERAKFLEFLGNVIEARSPLALDTSHEYYRLQSERWLETMLIEDITKIDSSLSPKCVYSQVPAFAGMERGVIDILSVTRSGHLAVIELKLHEEIGLPIQGLDYWLRVKWLQERGLFRPAGYFPGIELAEAPPLLYLVSPAFRFHSTIDRLVRYLHPSIKIIQVGLNDSWREGVKILFRHEIRGTVSTPLSAAEG